jgi:hypothetical protein
MSSPSSSPPGPLRNTGTTRKVNPANAPAPSSQGRKDFRKSLWVWIQELPQFGRFKPEEPDPNYNLLSKDDLDEVLKDFPQSVKNEIFEDMDFVEYELMRLFRDRDHRAKYNQNRYRRLQINFLILAVMATLIGSLQVIALNSSPEWMPLFAFLETLIALLTAFLAALGGREPPQEQWLSNRRRAEQLRREYFRFLTRMPPYDEVTGYRRRMLLSKRAADINRGMYPSETGVPEGGSDVNV